MTRQPHQTDNKKQQVRDDYVVFNEYKVKHKQLQEEGIEALVALLKTVDPEYHQKVDLGNPHRLIRALGVCLSSGQPYSSFLGNKKAPITGLDCVLSVFYLLNLLSVLSVDLMS